MNHVEVIPIRMMRAYVDIRESLILTINTFCNSSRETWALCKCVKFATCLFSGAAMHTVQQEGCVVFTGATVVVSSNWFLMCHVRTHRSSKSKTFSSDWRGAERKTINNFWICYAWTCESIWNSHSFCERLEIMDCNWNSLFYIWALGGWWITNGHTAAGRCRISPNGNRRVVVDNHQNGNRRKELCLMIVEITTWSKLLNSKPPLL